MGPGTSTMIRLHVNVDHVATLRQARRGQEPDPVAWALAAERAGAHGVTCHLRKDRRHFQDADLRLLRDRVTTLLNLECSLDAEMVGIALESGADEICLVPENRQEITTEGGLDAVAEQGRLAEALPRFQEKGMLVSLFLDPDEEQIAVAAELKADFVELHTGSYANADARELEAELERLYDGAQRAHELGLRLNAGHGLNYENVTGVVGLPHLEELNIGHSIVSRAVFDGVETAVREMLALVQSGVRA